MAHTPMPGPGGARPDDAIAAALREFEVIWDRLRPVAASVSGTEAGRVERTRLDFDASLEFAAHTALSSRVSVTSVNAGILLAMFEVARVLASTSDDPRLSDAAVSTEGAVLDAGARIAALVQWLTSAADHPVLLTPPSLGPDGETFANGIAIGAIAFVFAHELGHVVIHATDGTRDPFDREREADRWAAWLLRNIPVPPIAAGDAMTFANVRLDPDSAIPAAVMFLSLEGYHRRAEASFAAFESGLRFPEGVTVFDVTETDTHPSPYRRIGWLREDALTADADGSEVEGIDAVVAGFEALLPWVAAQMPEHCLSAAERARVLQGEPPEPVPDGTTWDYVYRDQVTGLLTGAAARGELTASDVDRLLDLIQEMPRSVLVALGDAVAGRLVPPEAPGAAAMTALAQGLPGRFRPPIPSAIEREAGRSRARPNP